MMRTTGQNFRLKRMGWMRVTGPDENYGDARSRIMKTEENTSNTLIEDDDLAGSKAWLVEQAPAREDEGASMEESRLKS